MQADLIQALVITAEVMGTELSQAAAKMMLADLSHYPVAEVKRALTRVRKECRGRLNLADILARIDDGRPTPDAAWAAMPWDERQTALMTSEMQGAWATCGPLVADGQRAAARTAFLAEYKRLVEINRAECKPVDWTVSFGYDASGRAPALIDGVRSGRIPLDYALRHLPERSAEAKAAIAAAGVTDHPQLAAPMGTSRNVAVVLKGLMRGAE